MKNQIFIIILMCLSGLVELQSQSSIPDHIGIKLYFNEDSSAYFRPIFVNQFWWKATSNNPGTADVDMVSEDPSSTSIGIRRARLLLLAELGPKVQVFTQIGINNQTFASGGAAGSSGVGGNGVGKKPQVFVHDAWAQYRLAYKKSPETPFPTSLFAGIGLHYWHGISRLSQSGIPSHMLLDFPIYNFPEIEQGDQFARQFGFYIKGDLGRIHYRAAINQPFLTDQRDAATEDRATLYPTSGMAYTAYAEYRFLDYEGHTLPFRPFTYIGAKKLLNIGAGFYHHPDGTATRSARAFTRHHKTVFSTDIYGELPMGEGNSAITFYAAYFNVDYGPNYYRSFGLLNNHPSNSYGGFDGDPSIDGFGNRQPLTGTGNILHGQLGYLFPKSVVSEGRIQLMSSVSIKSLDYLSSNVANYDIGANYFLKGHAIKFTLQYALRPLVLVGNSGGFRDGGHKGELLFQTQMAI